MYLIDFQYKGLTFAKNVFCLLFTSAFTLGHLLLPTVFRKTSRYDLN